MAEDRSKRLEGRFRRKVLLLGVLLVMVAGGAARLPVGANRDCSASTRPSVCASRAQAEGRAVGIAAGIGIALVSGVAIVWFADRPTQPR